jgi:hypothetical protein
MVLKKYGVRARNGFIWLRVGFSMGSCENGNEPLHSINRGEFFDYLSDLYL